MRTARLKQLIDEVVKSLPTPHTEDVIEDAFVAIEGHPLWRKSYDEMVYEMGKPAVNAWAGFWIAHAVGRVGDGQVPAARSSLIESYVKLVAPAAKRGKKLKEAEALKGMHDHFQAHRDTLPASIREQRELIVALIMAGIQPEVAFAKALEKPAFAR